ncbi:ashwin isoform X1 [Prionailurus viverrinus]|uniref:ashwin isoform X1 n=1 Tax=Lynx canadensis TaxID=61383 RepID=UPI0011AFF433|nr:ashwin isoform X1 [Lynx canadensis]XP_046924489.1 ashwin isoform X1 [Lynx rufus]XP_047709942.1 ashwin isoform X1 [Prionailurus viverrinus]XP_047709943.1 ashwin isoform X1 [Prionailurus viverrinus]
MAGDVGGRSCTDSELLLHPELLSQEFLLLTLEQKNIAVENDVRINKDNLTDLYVQHAIPLPQRDLPKNRWGKMMEKKREQHETKNETKRLPRGCLMPLVPGPHLEMSGTVDGLRKRPLIVFDGSSTRTSIKVKKTENGDNDRLKPPPQASFTSNAFRKLPNSSSSVSPLILSSNLPVNNKTEHNNNDTKQNHDLTHRKSPLGPAKSPPLSPVGTTPVKLKRAAPKEEAEAVNNLKPPEAKRKIQHVTWP